MVVGAYVLASARTVSAVPVVPNFTQGSMTSVTTQTVTTNETINSMDYATGWTYSVSGSGVEVEEGTTISPDVTSTQTNTNNGVTSTWTGLDLSTQNKPNWKQTEAGNAFQLVIDMYELNVLIYFSQILQLVVDLFSHGFCLII